MAKPRVFISSTFYDLKHIRSSLEQFVENLGYDAVLSEKGAIAYDPDLPLDESCYREVENSDIFVLIIGGRYGSHASGEDEAPSEDFFDRYASITKREYESAVKRDIPIYILVDRAVHTEYETFRKNRGKQDITYAHVDSVNVFLLIDDILSQARNNPIHQFDRHTEIATWLREQWGGLFKEMLSRRAGQQKLASLADQVSGLAEISTTLKTYLEVVVSNVSERDEAKKLIDTEEERLVESKRMQEFAKHVLVIELVDALGCTDLEGARDIFSKARSMEELAELYEELDPNFYNAERMMKYWREDNRVPKLINEVREILGLGLIGYTTSAARSTSQKKKKKTAKKKPK